MKHTELSSYDWDVLLMKSLMWIGLAALGFLSAMTGFFYAWVFVVYLGIAGFFIARRMLRRKILANLSRELWIVSGVIVAIVILFSLNTTPTVFSGRDQGTLSESAIRLAQNHHLAFSTPASQAFFKIYGPGKALNFPGFYYNPAGQLVPQFPLAYISWLAIFYSVFGLVGFTVANAILLIMFFLSFYALARHYIGRTYSAAALACAVTSFAFMWFEKFTLSENLALALLWIMILALVRFLDKQQLLAYCTFLAAGILLMFTRIEGIAFFAFAIIVAFSHTHARRYIMARYKQLLIIPLAILLLLFMLNLGTNMNFYRELAKALIGSLQPLPDGTDGPNTAGILPVFHTLQLLHIYGMLSFLILGFIGVAVSFVKKRFTLLTAFFIIAPSLVYLVDSHISADHPWMLRRYVFSILPAGIFYTIILLASWQETLDKRVRALRIALPACIIAALIALNMPSFLRYVAFSENESLLNQTESLSENFSPRDLVLVDRLATGDGWSMMTGPMNFLYGINAVYFFNTNDLAKIDLTQFDNVYLITPDIHRAMYESDQIGARLKPLKDYTIVTNALDISRGDSTTRVSLPPAVTTIIHGIIYTVTK